MSQKNKMNKMMFSEYRLPLSYFSLKPCALIFSCNFEMHALGSGSVKPWSAFHCVSSREQMEDSSLENWMAMMEGGKTHQGDHCS